jgi:hypothetical protein
VERVNLKSPELYSRAISCATLVLTGAVTPDPESGPNAYRVNGSKAEPYAVDLAGDCPCEDYQRRGIAYQGHKFCKHQLAALFYQRLSQQAERCRGAPRSARLQAFRPRQSRRPARAVKVA